MPAFAGMTPSMFIYEFSHSLIRRNDGVTTIYPQIFLKGQVEEVLQRPGEDRPGSEGSRVAIGRTSGGRLLRVIYVPDPQPDSIFVITAYGLRGKPLVAYRRRYRRKRK